MTTIILSLKKCLEDALASLPLEGHGERGKQNLQTPRVFIGDMPPKKSDASDMPCVLIFPVEGWQQKGMAYTTVAFMCCAYNSELDGDREGAEMDVALLISAVTQALMPFKLNPLNRKYILVPDSRRGDERYLPWDKSEMQPRPYIQATILSHWCSKGIE